MRPINYHILSTKSVFQIVFILSICYIFTSCAKDHAKIATSCETVDEVSFKKHIEPIFAKNCAVSRCHSGNNSSGKLNLGSSLAYDELMERKAGYIDTLVPEYSLLYSQIISRSQPMPPSGKLDDCQIALILKWIKQKAKNN